LISVIGINYDEFKPGSYKSTYLHVDEKRMIFNTGDPVEDFKSAILFGRTRGVVLYSSSVDHFIVDDPAYSYDENGLITREKET
jgi:hypothetical protein